MEPRKAELEKTPQPRPEQKQKRFRIVKLEERIAPGGIVNGRSGGCGTLHPGQC